MKWTLGAVAAGLIVLTCVVLALAHRAEPLMRAEIVRGLGEHFNSRVELDSFHVTLREGLWAEGKGLRIWPPADVEGMAVPGTTEQKPLIRLDEFRFHTPLHYKPGEAIRITVVQLKGLNVDVPSRPHFEREFGQGAKATDGAPKEAADLPAGPVGDASRSAGKGAGLLHFKVERLECTGAHLTIEPGKAAPGRPAKVPLEFEIAHLGLKDIEAGGPMGFEAELTNPRPQGTVYTRGSLGPWLVADPGETPLSGDYRFEHADLSVFKGIAGILNSTGHYQGTLREMVVDGVTDTPDFELKHFGTSMPLHTTFHALVDGTNGDTRLEPVQATLGKTHFVARGQVVRVTPEEAEVKGGPLAAGHEIALTVSVDRGRMEDFLRLTSNSGTPLITGELTMRAGLDIPPGMVPVHQRMKLKGTFTLDDSQFTSKKVQERIGELSARGQGRPRDAKNGTDADVRSRMEGDFEMAGGVVTLPALEYTVPGAVINLKGTYSVEGGVLDFAGTAKMQATVSEMVGGWKGLLLKPMDRFFKKDGAGTEVPIRIDGTRDDPRFGVDLGRMKTTSPQRPGEVRNEEPEKPQ